MSVSSVKKMRAISLPSREVVSTKMMSLPWNDQVNKSHSVTVSFLFTMSVRDQVPAAAKETE